MSARAAWQTCGTQVRRLHRDESGAVLVFLVFASILLGGFLLYLIRSSETLLHRELLQGSADSAAFGATAIKARGMNLIAFTNLLTSALTAILISTQLLGNILVVVAGDLAARCAYQSGPDCTVAQRAAEIRAHVDTYKNTNAADIWSLQHDLNAAQETVRIDAARWATAEANAVASDESYLGNWTEQPTTRLFPPYAPLPVSSGTFKDLCEHALREEAGRDAPAALAQQSPPRIFAASQPSRTAAPLLREWLNDLRAFYCTQDGPGKTTEWFRYTRPSPEDPAGAQCLGTYASLPTCGSTCRSCARQACSACTTGTTPQRYDWRRRLKTWRCPPGYQVDSCEALRCKRPRGRGWQYRSAQQPTFNPYQLWRTSTLPTCQGGLSCSRTPVCEEKRTRSGSSCVAWSFEQLYSCEWEADRTFAADDLPPSGATNPDGTPPAAVILWPGWLADGRNQVRAFSTRSSPDSQQRRGEVGLALKDVPGKSTLSLLDRDRMLAMAQAEFYSPGAEDGPTLWTMDWKARLVPFYVPSTEWDLAAWQFDGSDQNQSAVTPYETPDPLAASWEELAGLLPRGERAEGGDSEEDAVTRGLLVH